jgi:uncharacterized protein
MAFLPAGIDGLTALLLIVASFFTSALTAAFGIGGGVAMLGALAGAAPPNLIVAVHGVVQLGSNLGRAILQRAHANWPAIGRFMLGSAIGVALGAALFVQLPRAVLLGVLALFILAMVWLPKPRIPGFSKAGLFLGGVISSILTMFIGATGSFVQALIMPLGLDRKAFVATHAAMMVGQHLLKVIAFGLLGLALIAWLPLVAAMIVSGFIGTVSGTKLLNRMPESLFQITLKILLTLIALDLIRQAAGIRLPGF